ncbi:MAG: acyltransferase family protein, partial [Angustibacter sp.]
VTRYGYLGVDLFFMISGFVILLTAWGSTLPRFVASRVARLFPAYWAGVLLTGGMLLATGSLLKDISPIDLIVNLTMMQQSADVPSVDGAYWTLWIELRFYVIIGVFMLLGITRNRVLAFGMLWPVLAMVAHDAGVGVFGTLFLPRQAPLFALGMLLYLCYKDGFDVVVALAMATQLAFSLHYAYVDLSSIGKATGSTAHGLVAAGIVLAAFGLIVAAIFGPGRRISWPWLTALGALTYPLYILHEYWGWFIIRITRDSLSPYAAVALATAICLGMAWLVLRFIERPLTPLLRRSVRVGLTRVDLVGK